MFAASFDYYRAGSIGEAHQLLRAHAGAKLLAGGHSLIPLMKMRLATPTAVVDIGRIPDLKGISASGGLLRIGSLTTHAELASSAELRSACPMLPEAAAMIGDAQVRNVGTIGGNIAHADPASDLPTVLLALDATIHVAGPNGVRTIPVGGFFHGMMTTAIESDEILTAIEVPVKPAGQGMAYMKFSHPASRYAVLGVAAVVSVADGICTSARLAIGGLLPAPVRCSDVERTIEKQSISSDRVSRAAAEVQRVLNDDVMGDIFASADYRKAMAPVYVARALTSAFSRTAS
jgi:aerobic carbon-monoxide dehydrogenase medium subunit